MREIMEKIIDDTGKSYEILAEIYNEDNFLQSFVVINKYGKVMQISSKELEKWS